MSKPKLWQPLDHTDDENAKWCLARATEWAYWPLFLSPLLIPAMLLFISWQAALVLIVAINVVWPVWIFKFDGPINLRLAELGGYLQKVRWIVAPLVAIYCVYHYQFIAAAICLIWPIWLPKFYFKTVSVIYQTLVLFGLHGGPVIDLRNRFMVELGYEPASASPAEG